MEQEHPSTGILREHLNVIRNRVQVKLPSDDVISDRQMFIFECAFAYLSAIEQLIAAFEQNLVSTVMTDADMLLAAGINYAADSVNTRAGDVTEKEITESLYPKFTEECETLINRMVIHVKRGAVNNISFEPFEQDEWVYSIPRTHGSNFRNIYKKTTMNSMPLREGQPIWNPITRYVPTTAEQKSEIYLGRAHVSNSMAGGRSRTRTRTHTRSRTRTRTHTHTRKELKRTRAL